LVPKNEGLREKTEEEAFRISKIASIYYDNIVAMMMMPDATKLQWVGILEILVKRRRAQRAGSQRHSERLNKGIEDCEGKEGRERTRPRSESWLVPCLSLTP
jgi:uncharacterized protein (DUF2384 family)